MKNFYLNLLGLRAEEFQPNPKRDEKNTNDCIIRAFCKFLNKDWDYVFNGLSSIAFEEKQIFNHPNVITKYANKYNFTYTRVLGNTTTAGEFMYNHKFGKYIIGIPRHAFAYIDGVVYDISELIPSIDNGLTAPILYYITSTCLELPGGKGCTYQYYNRIRLDKEEEQKYV